MAFNEAVEKGLGWVVILAGSDSDRECITALEKALDKYEIVREVRIASAHKQPEKVVELVREYDAIQGHLIYIAVAGGTDALSGMLSFHSIRPVVSCPPEFDNADGKGVKGTINTSCLTNPSMSSNAYVARAANAARFAAQCFSFYNTKIADKLIEEVRSKITSLEQADILEKKSLRLSKSKTRCATTA